MQHDSTKIHSTVEIIVMLAATLFIANNFAPGAIGVKRYKYINNRFKLNEMCNKKERKDNEKEESDKDSSF